MSIQPKGRITAESASTSKRRMPANLSEGISSQLIGADYSLWQPMEDQVFIERLEPIEQERKSQIVVTDMETADNKMLLRKGKVLAVGPGKWIPGEWWKLKVLPFDSGMPVYSWEWIPGYRETPAVKPGQLVIFNARWNDLAHAEHRPVGSDMFSRSAPVGRPLSYRFDPKVHLVQEADIAGIVHE